MHLKKNSISLRSQLQFSHIFKNCIQELELTLISHHSGEEQGKFIILRTIRTPTPLQKVPIEIVFHPFTIFFCHGQDSGRMAQKCFPLSKTPPPAKEMMFLRDEL